MVTQFVCFYVFTLPGFCLCSSLPLCQGPASFRGRDPVFCAQDNYLMCTKTEQSRKEGGAGAKCAMQDVRGALFTLTCLFFMKLGQMCNY